ncbi:MAG: hypothetical protein WKF74_13410 [Pyrinomonadaceae bacterium]
MKRKLKIAGLILLVALCSAAQAFRSATVLKETARCWTERFWESNFGIVSAAEAGSQRQDDRDDLPERDEIRQSHQLAPGATVEVASINGSVTIETSETNTAEVLVVRSARERGDLQRRRVIVEATPQSLVVRGEKEERNSWRGGDVRQRVVLRLPRRVEMTVRGVNGRVSVGELEGAARLSGINGRVEVAQAIGYSEVSGINGAVQLTIAQLGERGLRMSGINGAIDLRFDPEVNADLSISGHNGGVDTQLPNVTLQGKLNRSNLRARIGAGGAPITLSGINGRVRLGLREG